MIKRLSLCLVLIFVFVSPNIGVSEDRFTQKDRELLIELKVKMGEIDKRFEQIDKRFEQMMDFLKILTGLFGGLIVTLIGFVLWDRRTLLKEAKREAAEYIDKDSVAIKILREYAAQDDKMREVLKSFRML